MNELSEYTGQCRPPNPLTPIFQLNDDILLYIFSINSQVPPTNFLHDTYETKPLHTTIATSQVCSHWRLLCLSTSTLWSNINLVKTSPEWSEEILRRASSSPIALRYYKTNNYILIPLVRRLQAFTGSCHEARWVILTSEAQRAGSKLRSLSLFGRYKHFNLHIHQLASHALPLKHLALDEIYIRSLQFHFLSNLSTLALNRTFTSAKALINGLMHLPGLTELILFDVIREEDGDEPLDINTLVSLPNLKKLELDSSDNEPLYMLCLHVPAACIFQVNFIAIYPTPEIVVSLLSKLLIPQFIITGNQSISFILGDHSINVSNEPSGFHQALPTDNGFLNQYFCEQYSGVSIRDSSNHTWAPPLYLCLGLLFAPGAVFSSITTLQLTIFEPYDYPFPFEIFHNISVLFVGFDTFMSILLIIGESGPPFPSLKKLGLIVSNSNQTLELDAVIFFLSSRREHDAQVNTLELRYISRDESWTSFVTVSQRRKLELLEVDLTLFFVVDKRFLVRTGIVELPVGAHDHEVHKLKCL